MQSLLLLLLLLISHHLVACQLLLGTQSSLQLHYPAIPSTTLYSYVLDSQPALSSGMPSFRLALVATNYTGTVLCWLHILQDFLSVWTANVNSPVLPRSSCTIELTKDGDLVLSKDGESAPVWSSGTAGQGVQSVELQSSGNLVLLNVANRTVWQSFEHPSNTLLSGQKLQVGMSLRAPASSTNFSLGQYSLAFLDHDLRLFGYFSGDWLPYWSITEDAPIENNLTVAYAALGDTGLSLYAANSTLIGSLGSSVQGLAQYVAITPDGNLQTFFFSGQQWNKEYEALSNSCMYPDSCGPYGICTRDDNCTCPPYFFPRDAQDSSQGCAPSLPFGSCRSNSRNQEILKLPGYTMEIEVPSINGITMDACSSLCMNNCSCGAAIFTNASASLDINVSSCYIHTQVRTIAQSRLADDNPTALVKVPKGYENTRSEVPRAGPSPGPSRLGIIAPSRHSSQGGGLSSRSIGIISGVIIAASVLVCILLCRYFYLKQIKKQAKSATVEEEDFLDALPGLPPRFLYKDLKTATNGFTRKLGVGGFGSVYEGLLPDKTRVAVKQLEGAGQGKKQFRAEVATIGGIRHVNLVRLRGFCIEGSHRLLVYELMVNGSLDRHLFGKFINAFSNRKGSLLDWGTRYAIALGTARGLAYLHEDCTERVIHCDIKPENILLDERFVAKIADFGLSKLMTREQSYAVTTMRGTRGYLAPEWLRNAPITEKSDVYSYGMVLLELVSGRKNTDIVLEKEQSYFPDWAAAMVMMGHSLLELVDERLEGKVDEEELGKIVKIALWCLQEDTSLRPSMWNVVKMLQGDLTVPIPPLSQPSYFSSTSATETTYQTLSDPSQQARSTSESHQAVSSFRSYTYGR